MRERGEWHAGTQYRVPPLVSVISVHRYCFTLSNFFGSAPTYNIDITLSFGLGVESIVALDITESLTQIDISTYNRSGVHRDHA